MLSDRRLTALQAILAFVLLAAACLRIGSVVGQLDHLQMDMDEATHAMHGLELAAAFSAGDSDRVREEILRPHWYPPGYGLGLAAWLNGTTADLRWARLYSLFHYGLFGLLLGLIGLAGTNGRLLAVRWIPLLFLLADIEHWAYSAMTMLELPVVFVSVAGLFAFSAAEERRSAKLYLLAFLLGTVCFFLKYSSGAILLTAMGLSHIVGMMKARPKDAPWLGFLLNELRPVVPGLLAALVALATWLFALGQFRWFWTYAQAQPSETSLLSWDNLSFYPRFLLADPVRGLALIGGLAALPFLLRSRHAKKAILLGVYLLLGLIMTTITTQNSDRFLVPFLPALWLLVALGLDLLSERRAAWGKVATGVVSVALILGFGWNYVRFGTQMPFWYENTNDGVARVYQYVADNLDVVDQPPTDVALLGRTDQWNARGLAFVLKSAALRQGDAVYASRLQVQDERDMERGWPRMRYSKSEREARRKAGMDEAQLLVTLNAHPDDPTRWSLGATATFLCQGTKYPDTQLEVRLYRRASSSSSSPSSSSSFSR